MANMQHLRYGQQSAYWANQHERPVILTHSPMPPPIPPTFPDFRIKRRKDGTCAYLVLIFLLVLLALAGVGLGTYKIIELQKDMDALKELSGEANLSPSLAKLTGLEKPPEKNDGRQAAHVTGKISTTLPLSWEDVAGRAFTAGIRYKNRGLIVNKTGLHFVYSSIYFRGNACPKDKELTHIVYKKTSRYPQGIKLMENREDYNCTPRVIWGRHSYLGAVFNLTAYEALYVNVSNVSLVGPDETKTFFGLYRL
ncbi:tumor necrosis factor ligand superfamily member 6 [Hyla sarda]|uniref:tumor necrosis factor ligand superfamily member 6 n=1 Tax=Hyla sarda TaxID=327740 RepID=UPI0024C2DBBB|nr:tumor necrosis factor ligand superfamily member 6 [Hyla sarda]